MTFVRFTCSMLCLTIFHNITHDKNPIQVHMNACDRRFFFSWRSPHRCSIFLKIVKTVSCSHCLRCLGLLRTFILCRVKMSCDFFICGLFIYQVVGCGGFCFINSNVSIFVVPPCDFLHSPPP